MSGDPNAGKFDEKMADLPLSIGLSLSIIEEYLARKGNLYMALICWQPLQEMETLRRQMDHLFDVSSQLMLKKKEISESKTPDTASV